MNALVVKIISPLVIRRNDYFVITHWVSSAMEDYLSSSKLNGCNTVSSKMFILFSDETQRFFLFSFNRLLPPVFSNGVILIRELLSVLMLILFLNGLMYYSSQGSRKVN